jgi:hypothetical protein
LKRKRTPVKRKRDPRKEAFTRLSEQFAKRSREADDETNLSSAMEGQPKVTSSLKMASGGLPVVLNALRAFDDEDAQQFIALHDSLSYTDRRHLTLEEIAVAADIGASRLLGVATEALQAYGTSVSQIILGASLPKIVKKSVAMAQTSKGMFDREMMLKAGAVLPIPKGSQIAIQQVNTPVLAEAGSESLPPWDQEARLRAVHSAWGETKALPSPTHPQPIPASVDSIQQRTVEALTDV